jgi:hypothetical protein
LQEGSQQSASLNIQEWIKTEKVIDRVRKGGISVTASIASKKSGEGKEMVRAGYKRATRTQWMSSDKTDVHTKCLPTGQRGWRGSVWEISRPSLEY